MKAKLFLVTLSLVAIVLSGCIFEPADDAEPTGTRGDNADADIEPVDTNETEDDEPVAAPAEVPAAISTRNTSGEAPFQAVFDLSSNASSPQFLDWTFDADGDGTADETGYGLPADVMFTYEETGNFTATLSVTDPEGGSGNATLDIQVVPPPEVVLPDTVTFSGTITGLSNNIGGYVIGSEVEHEFNHTVPVQNITITFSTGDTAVDLDFVLLRSDGEEVETRQEPNDPTGLALGKSEAPILVEDPEHLAVFGTWVIVVEPYISFEGDYTIEVTFG